MQNRNRNKKKELGCCGYDETSYKPPTTTPMRATMRAAKLDWTGKGNKFPVRQIGAPADQNSAYPIGNMQTTSRIWL